MKTVLTFLMAATLGYGIQAQMPASPDPDAAALQSLKINNQALLEKQAATLTTLEELKEMAQQLKIYSRRG